MRFDWYYNSRTVTKTRVVRLNANRRVTGVLRGYDQFMNIVLENTVEEVSASERNEIGMVVGFFFLPLKLRPQALRCTYCTC